MVLLPLGWALAAPLILPAAAQRMAPLPPATTAAMVLTWRDCVALAAIKNPTLVSAEYSETSARASYLETFNGFMPNVSLSDSYSAGAGEVSSYSPQVSATMNLFNMAQVATIKTASDTYTQADANRRLASATLRYNLRSAFATAYFAEENVEVSRRILDIQRKNADEVVLRYKGGREYKGDMMNAQSQAVQALANLNQALRGVRTAFIGLDQELGLDDFSVVTVTGTLEADYPPDFPARMRDFLARRPDVAVQQAAVAQEQDALDSARSALWPSLSASYSAFSSGPHVWGGPGGGWDLGATLSLPIFGSGPTAAYYSIQSSRRALDASKQTLLAVEQAAIANLEDNWASYGDAVEQEVAAEDVLAAARQRNNEAEIRYASGLITYDDWTVIVSAWVSAEQSAVSARLNAVEAQAAWEQSLGEALGE